MTRPRIAHFLLVPELAGSPPNRAALDAYRDLGFHIDLYAPRGGPDVSDLGEHVSALPVEYGVRWLARHAASPRWRRYSAFSGTTEDPQAVAGLLSRLHRRPLITFADEIYSGTYAGDRPRRWKQLCRQGMARARLTIVNEAERIPLQRDYAGLPPDAPVIVYPGCFHAPPEPGDRQALRAFRGLPQDALVLAYSGVFNHGNGGLWLLRALEDCPELWVWGQVLHNDPLVNGLLTQVRGGERLVLEPSRLGWREAWASMAAVDIGQVVYLSDAPQFRHMGIASNRLCMFLTMGVPVIASRQPSFAFLEEHDCGVLIDGPEQMAEAVRRIAARLETMKANALRCSQEVIRAPQRWQELREAIAAVVPPRGGAG
jgi:glycosyltransferase involved in cell wall biosynthesis